MIDDRDRDWRGYWSEVEPLPTGELDEALKQVGKTQMGVPVGEEQIALILTAITEALDLQASDHLVDLGCGNGLVSERIGPRVASVLGVDASPQLIADACRFRATEHLQFQLGDLADPALLADWPGERAPGPVWKWYSYEVIQHLAPEELKGFLERLAERLSDGGVSMRLFLGSIPDRDRLRAFYDTPERWAYYQRNLAAGVEQIGTWWGQEELRSLAEAAGFACSLEAQDPALYTAHYRFHALLTFPAGGGPGHA